MASSMTKTPSQKKPSVVRLDHIALHVRSVNEATRFWTEVLGAEPYKFDPQDPRLPLFAVKFGGSVLAFFEPPGLTAWDKEFPHYAFNVETDDMVAFKERLDAAGVKTHPIWTRFRKEALMYFRDPSGNLFELYCDNFKGADKLPLAVSSGGDFRAPIGDISYDWKG